MKCDVVNVFSSLYILTNKENHNSGTIAALITVMIRTYCCDLFSPGL
jgi:hypothetical protein